METPWPTQSRNIPSAFLSFFLFLKRLTYIFLAVIQAHYFLSTLHSGKQIIPSHFATALLVWEDGPLLSWEDKIHPRN